MSKVISIVIPVLNEEEGISHFLDAVLQEFDSIKLKPEIVIVDDGSTDGTLFLLKKQAEVYSNIKIVSLTRNFGHQAAIAAGLEHATGDAVITMDADFQDPPSVSPELIQQWKKGYKVVFTKRKRRKDNIFKRATASIYYALLYRYSDIKIKGNIGDYRLIDKAIHENLKGIKEKSKYLRGLISWMGYKYEVVEFDRPKRMFGSSKFSFLKMFRLAMEGILNFSLVPLRLGFLLGILIIPIGLFFIGYILVDTLILGEIYPLYKWISVITFTFQGFMFILMWILAEYIGKIYEQDRSRPQFVIAEKINLE